MRFSALFAGLIGIALFVIIHALDSVISLFTGYDSKQVEGVARAGFVAFLYLEVLDASFSLDGVIGAFAITRDVVIIMLGLAIGAVFVRSLTIMLVRTGTLQEYIYLEHGAHYAIGALGIAMLISSLWHIPEWNTGTVGILFIALSLISSIIHKRKNGQ